MARASRLSLHCCGLPWIARKALRKFWFIPGRPRLLRKALLTPPAGWQPVAIGTFAPFVTGLPGLASALRAACQLLGAAPLRRHPAPPHR